MSEEGLNPRTRRERYGLTFPRLFERTFGFHTGVDVILRPHSISDFRDHLLHEGIVDGVSGTTFVGTGTHVRHVATF